MTFNDFTWNFQKINNGSYFDSFELNEFYRVCVDGFGIEIDWNSENKSKLSQVNLLGKLTNKQNKLCGIAYYFIPPVSINNTYMIWESGICIVKEAQNLGLSKAAIKHVKSLFSDHSFQLIGCKSQNPKMFLRYQKFGITYPFDESYSTSQGKKIMSFLISNIKEVKKLHFSKQLNVHSGICTTAYTHGCLGDYKIDIKEAKVLENKLTKLQFNRNNGDAILIISRNKCQE